MKKLSCLLILAWLTACSHCPHCATKQGHEDCCGSESGTCPHGNGGKDAAHTHSH